MRSNRETHERAIFLQVLNLPGEPEPYDLSQPFDAQKLMRAFIEEERIVHAVDDPVLGGLAACAEAAWAAFLAVDEVTLESGPLTR